MKPTNKQKVDVQSVGFRLDAWWEVHEMADAFTSFVRFGDQIVGRCKQTGRIYVSNIES